jgi:hypothetical protein
MATMVREYRGACMVASPFRNTLPPPVGQIPKRTISTSPCAAGLINRRLGLDERESIIAADGIQTTHKGTRPRADATISAVEPCAGPHQYVLCRRSSWPGCTDALYCAVVGTQPGPEVPHFPDAMLWDSRVCSRTALR